MRIPEFTGGTSHYKSSVHYSMTRHNSHDGLGVVPARITCPVPRPRGHLHPVGSALLHLSLLWERVLPAGPGRPPQPCLSHCSCGGYEL
jgi:hypothetical protein